MRFSSSPCKRLQEKIKYLKLRVGAQSKEHYGASCASHSAPSPSTTSLGLVCIWVSKVKMRKKVTPQRCNVLGNLETVCFYGGSFQQGFLSCTCMLLIDGQGVFGNYLQLCTPGQSGCRATSNESLSSHFLKVTKCKQKVLVTLVKDKNPACIFLQRHVSNHFISNLKPFVLKSSCFVQQ